MKPTTLWNELWIPTVALLFFFLLQAFGALSELALTVFVIAVSSLVFYWKTRLTEAYLFGIGVASGLFVEIGFRLLGYQQVWLDASLFGIPYWLPIAWGMGFVLITRLGIYTRGLPLED